MTILNILEYPEDEEALRQKSEPVVISSSGLDPGISKLIDDMIETMHHHDGIGLAAPQVNEHLRIIVVQAADGDIVIINPIIQPKSKATSRCEEGCLSVPGFMSTIERPERIQVTGLDKDAKPLLIEIGGMLSTCIQHEVDHLDGVLFIDRMSKLQKDLAKKKLKELRQISEDR